MIHSFYASLLPAGTLMIHLFLPSFLHVGNLAIHSFHHSLLRAGTLTVDAEPDDVTFCVGTDVHLVVGYFDSMPGSDLVCHIREIGACMWMCLCVFNACRDGSKILRW